jgi:signal transduction histidine kinase/ActR/RegA family two-component response regulator
MGPALIRSNAASRSSAIEPVQFGRRHNDRVAAEPEDMSWQALPRPARVYVVAVLLAGSGALLALLPQSYPEPILFVVALAAACLTAAWKVNLLIPLGSGSTLSVSYAAKLMALLLLGPGQAVLIGAAGAFTQCTYHTKQRYPLYRTLFSVTAEAITMAATGLVYAWLGGGSGPFEIRMLARPLVGAIATYFLVNTSLVAGAIALSTGRRFVDVWRNDFLWSGVTFMVAGTVGALAAVVIDRGEHWVAIILLAPVYLTYRTYHQFVGRFDDQQRHMAEMRRMHRETVEALSQAHEAERALASEKERLAVALADMTRLEEMREELLGREQSARASAEEANRLKDQFLAVVSHELRTPLNAILGWADMLGAGMLKDDRRARAYQIILDSAKRQSQLIDDLLDVARIMSGKLRLERALIDFEEVVRAALHVVQPAADARRVRIRLDAEPSIGLIYGDRNRLQQVVWNLLSNAIKFSNEGGDIAIRLHRRRDLLELTVKDSGHGIPREFLGSVFEPFRQADGSTTRLHGGLGLGLSIVKHLVEAHSGVVSAQSAGEGHGAAFVVRLPIVSLAADLSASTDQKMTQSDNAPFQSLEGVSVLVVDDDKESREVVSAHLEGHQAAVFTAASAAQAVALLQREHVDVLLADIAMPGEDGYALIRKVRALDARTASIPAAALTAFARNEDRQLALQAGFQLHLTKPIDAATLVAAVASLSGKRDVAVPPLVGV